MEQQQPIEPEIVEDTHVVAPGALEAITRGEIDVAISTAKRFPRNPERFKINALAAATATQEIAESCNYYLERRDKDGTVKPIEGPSIRLAEICMTFFQNTRWGGRIVGEDDSYVHAQGIAHDLENNTFVQQEVARKITNRTGKRYSADMVAVTAAAAISIAMRNAAFRVIPRGYVEDIRLKAKKLAMGDAKTVAQRWDAASKWFASVGVDTARLLKKLGREKIEDVTPDDIGKLNGLRTSLKDGMTTVDEQFPAEKPPEEKTELEGAPAPAETAGDKTAEKIEKKRGRPKKETEPQPAPPAPAPPADRDALLAKLRDMLGKTFETGPQIDNAILQSSKGTFPDWYAFAAGATIEAIEESIRNLSEFIARPKSSAKPAADFHDWIGRATQRISTPEAGDEDRATYAIRVLRGFEMLEMPEAQAFQEAASATGGAVDSLEKFVAAPMDQLKQIHRHLMAIG